MMIAVAAIQRWLGSRTLTQPFHDISHHSSLTAGAVVGLSLAAAAAAAAAPITAITAITGGPIMRALSLSMWHWKEEQALAHDSATESFEADQNAAVSHPDGRLAVAIAHVVTATSHVAIEQS
jgi:hypothetical protein